MTTASPSTIEHEIGSTGLLEVRLAPTGVRLRAVDGGMVRVHGDRDLESTVTVSRGEGSLSIRAGHDGLFRSSRRPPGSDLIVEVPTLATVVIETASGDIAATGLLGDQRYRTASGEVHLDSVSGRIVIEAVSGDVDASATGSLALEARTVSGDLTLRAASVQALHVATTSGDLRLTGTLDGTGPFRIETVSGDVVLGLDGDVRIEMQTVAGDLRSDVAGRSEGGRGRRTLIVGSGGPTVTARTMSGDVRLTRSTTVEVPAAPPAMPVMPVMPTMPTMPTMPAMPVMPTIPPIPGLIPATPEPAAADHLAILRALERGEIDVAEAGRRLEALDASDASSDV